MEKVFRNAACSILYAAVIKIIFPKILLESERSRFVYGGSVLLTNKSTI